MEKQNDLSFREVTASKKDSEILYDLLAQRKHTISHEILPSKKEHLKFVFDHPYRYWFLILEHNNIIGAFYITFNNSISIDLMPKKITKLEEILKLITENFQPMPEKKSIVPSYFYINLAIDNQSFIDELMRIKWKPIQMTFRKAN